ncbi:serine/threonine-protein phosphatase 2A activator-like [Harmonia axyridis]|uniref:serine/threonine-protein phosphatase 2A activator-like n=1 Tax=Harmonia axyridis TaxID=115357 RepID=UPI001E276200|nr:serine/threonine-protein phosphatase 2A activator-like [Harmonia axyridis]
MNRPPPNYVTGTNCVVDEDHQYTVPIKMIKTQIDMPLWEKSEAYLEYLGFVLAINQAIEGKSNDEGSKNSSEQVNNIDIMLNSISKIIDETPAIDQPQRFGNQAFRTFYQKLKDDLFNLLQTALPERLYRSIPEIMIYLLEGFGNSTRIDYGTGHEISFVMFLCCLFKIGFFTDTDKPATGCKIFSKYLDICRKLQQTYRMEPAGSHGVWSLDDYQFVPFIWGSSQLIGHPKIEPSSFLKKNIVDQYALQYMFLSCIRYINQVKTGPFSEHSNQLWNVSGVPSWNRVNGGLVKMYKAEVLAKFPVVQHIVFGTLLPLTMADPNSAVRKMKSTLAVAPKEIEPLVFQPPKTPSGDQASQEEEEEESESSKSDEVQSTPTPRVKLASSASAMSKASTTPKEARKGIHFKES